MVEPDSERPSPQREARDPLFSVVIATLSRPQLLRDTLKSIGDCRPGPHEILVVDGDAQRSAEPVVTAFRERAPQIDVRYLTAGRGLPLQRNVGIDAASGDVLVFVDDDVQLGPRTFAILSETYRDPSTTLGATGWVREEERRALGRSRSIARRLVLPGREGTMTRFGYPRRIQDPTRFRDVEFMTGAFMTVRTAAARQVRFDETLPGYALAEDEDFSYRVSRLGRIRYRPDLVVDHHATGFGTADLREFNHRLVVNRAHLFRKNFRRTRRSRLQFALMVALLGVHRAANREWAGVRGLLEGSQQAWRERA